MSKISTYEVAPVPKLSDKLIGTSVGGEIEDITYNFTLLELLELFLPVIPANNLQGVLDYGNTATQDINLFGTITTTNLEVTDTANLFITYLNEETHIVGSLFDSADSIGTAGQVLTSTGDGVEWFTLPPIFTPNLQQVLEEGNTADLDIILDADLEAINITADTANIATQLSIQGTVVDYNESAGTSGQVLESTSTGVQWVNLPVYSATSPLLFDSGTNTFSIQVANSTQGGYLTANDWVTFDGKQNAGAYITALTGEATATGPGSVPITLNNASVIAKVLTGLNITGGSISATDSILTAFGKVQNQINGLMGGVQYQGVWDAATNTPTLTSSVGTQGHYYIVNVAGTTNLNGITDWQVGDWAIFSGGAWQKVDNTDSVTSVNGQTGAVSLTTDNIPEGTTNLYFLDSRARAAVSATSPLSYNNTTGVFSIQQASGTQNGYLSSTDWTTFNNKQNYLSGTGLVKSTAGTITYITDNSSNWNTAYNRSIISAAVTGTGTKTLTLNEQDGNTITASWSDADTGLTSVGLTMPSAFSVANSPLTSNGTIGVTGAGTTAEYIRGDGSLATFPSIISEAQNLITEVYNSSGATLTKGTVVYINGGQGNLPTITKAIATGDPTSAQTYGVVRSDITNMNNGYVVVTGRLSDLDTRDYTPGQQLYLSSTTAGAWTPTKQYAPAHLVYVGIVVRAHPTQGVVEILIQNGFEMDELHNVAAQNPDNNDILQFKTSTNLWTKVAGTTTNIAEGTNLYYLDSRARAALSFTPGSGAYNSTTGVITIPTNTNQLTNGAAFITLGSLSALAPLSYNNTTGVFSISQSGASTDGYLSSTDWNTFNNKQPAGSYVPTSRLLSINGTQYDLSADRSWSVGTVTSVAALTLGTSGTDLSSTVATATTTPVITLNVPTASAANRGALSAADWSTFNTKVGSVTASSPLSSSGGQTPNITIQQASGSQDGYLSSTDWTTFNNKQAAGNYITSLTGEATASGPGAAAVTLNNASVTAKVLTGINITGGTVQATDTMLTAFGKLQNQINGLVGGSIYQGTWNAATNTPALASGVGTKGYYYIVSVAGTTNLDGITDWFVGDWAIFDGTAWQQVDNTDAVVSVNGQTGAVSLTTDNIPEGSTNQYYLDSRARAALSFTAGSGAYNSTTGVITIPTNTSQLTNGANFITLASLSGTAPIQYNNTTGAISITQSGTASNGYLSSTDWNTFNNKAPSVSGGYLPLSGGTMTGAITLPNGVVGIVVGDDATISDRNVANTMYVAGVQDTTKGYINFSESAGNQLGAINGGDLTWRGVPIITTSNVSGTVGYIPKFTAANSVGNSIVQDEGTNITVAGGVTAAGIISTSGTGLLASVRIANTTATTGKDWHLYSLNNGNFGLYNNTDANYAYLITPSGNLGLGVIPSAWGSGFTALQVKNASFWSTGNDASITTNAYYDGTNYKYIAASASARTYYNTDGSVIWSQAPTGTAGANITFSPVMTLDSSGRLGIGVTPTQSLDVIGNGKFRGQDLFLGSSTDADNVIYIYSKNGAQSQIRTNAGVSSSYNGMMIASNYNQANNLSSWSLDLGGALNSTSNVNTFTVGYKAFGGAWSSLMIVNATGDTTISNNVTAASAIFNNGTNSTNGIKIIGSLTSSAFTSGIEFIRTTVTGGSKIQPLRDTAIGGVGLNFLVTANNAAEISATYTSALQILNTGVATFTNSLTSSGTNLAILSPSLGTNSSVYAQIGKDNSTTNNSGELSFKYVSSASASNMISLGFYGNGQLLNVLANGRVGIGVSPNTLLDIFKSSYTGNQFRTYAELQAAPSVLSYSTSDGMGLIINMYEAIAGPPYTRYADFVASTSDVSSSVMRFFTKNYSSNPAVALTLASTGAATFSNSITASGALFTAPVSINGSSIPSDRWFEVTGTTSGKVFGAVFNPTFTYTGANIYGIYVGNNFNTGTITNSYNLYIEGTSVGSATITNRYGLYQAGGADKNYFAGTSTFGFQTVATNSTINLDSVDPALRFRVSGGTAGRRIYDLRAIAAGGAFDYLQIRLWNDAQTSASELFKLDYAGAGTFSSDITTGGLYTFSSWTTGTVNKIRGYSGNDDKSIQWNYSNSPAGTLIKENNSFLLSINGANTLFANSTGVGIGLTNPTYNLDVNGSMRGSDRFYWNGTNQLVYILNYQNLPYDGQVVTDATANQGTAVKKPASGYGSSTFFYGNYTSFPPGNYVAYFRMKVASNASGASLGTLDVVGGSIVPFAIALRPNMFEASDTWQYIRLPFTITGGSYIEWRMVSFQTGITDLFFDHVMVYQEGSLSQIFARTSYSIYVNQGELGMQLNTSGAMTVTSSVTATAFFESSDSRLKNLIKDDYKAIGIETIKPKLYIKDGREEVGYFAQDVKDKLSTAVSVNDAGFLSLSYTQVHTAKIASLEARVKELELQLKNE